MTASINKRAVKALSAYTLTVVVMIWVCSYCFPMFDELVDCKLEHQSPKTKCN